MALLGSLAQRAAARVAAAAAAAGYRSPMDTCSAPQSLVRWTSAPEPAAMVATVRQPDPVAKAVAQAPWSGVLVNATTGVCTVTAVGSASGPTSALGIYRRHGRIG